MSVLSKKMKKLKRFLLSKFRDFLYIWVRFEADLVMNLPDWVRL